MTSENSTALVTVALRPAQLDLSGALSGEATVGLMTDAVHAALARAGIDRAALARASAQLRITGIEIEAGPARPGDGMRVSVRADETAAGTAGRLSLAVVDASGAVAARGVVGWTLSAAVDASGAIAPPDDLPPPVAARLMKGEHCDQAGHVNVQVFLDLADDGLAGIGEALKLAEADCRLRFTAARVQFKSELFAGDSVSVRSFVRGVGSDGLQIAHAITRVPGGPATCVVETTAAPVGADGRARALPAAWKAAAEAAVADWAGAAPPKPLGEPGVPATPPANAVETCRETIDTWDVDGDGLLSSRAMIRWFSTGARQYLGTIGLDGARFARDQITVAAVDYAITVPARPRQGANIVLRSAPLDVGAKSMRFFHHMTDADTGEIYATVLITGVMLDLRIRRSMEVPADVRERLKARLEPI